MDFERSVDATLARKKEDVREALKRADRVPRTVRVYVFNTFRPASRGGGVAGADAGIGAGAGAGAERHTRASGGGAAAAAAAAAAEVEPASWTLHVQGRVLTPAEAGCGGGAGERGDPGGHAEAAPKFSSFVRSLEAGAYTRPLLSYT